MNKLIKSIACASLILSASACSMNKTTTVSNGDEVFFSVGNTKVTKSDVYQYMKLQNLDTGIIAMAEEDLINELVPVTDEMNQKVDEMIAADKELYGEDTFLQMITYYGFEDEQAYRDAYLINMRMTELTHDYIETNWDSLMDTYKPIKANVLSFVDNANSNEPSESTEEGEETTESQAQINANEALTALKDGSKDLETIINDYELTANVEPTIYLNNNQTLPTAVLTYLQTNQLGYCNEVIFDDSTGTPTYYVINIVENDANNMKDDVLTSLSSVSDVAVSADQDLLRSHNFFVYDQMVLEALRANYNGYLTDKQQAPTQTAASE